MARSVSPATTCCCRRGPRRLRTCGCCCCATLTPSRSGETWRGRPRSQGARLGKGEGKGLAQLELVPRCVTYNPKKLLSPPPGGGQWTLNLSLCIPRVAGDSGTITLRCKDLRVLQLDIEGVEATLDIARSIEVRQGCNGGT